MRSSHVRSSQYLLQTVEYNNITCCTTFRSLCKNVVKDRFLPPPFTMCRSLNNEFTWIRSDKTSHYLSLHQTIAMSGVIPNFFLVEISSRNPIWCIQSTVKSDLKNWMCSICGKFFGTIITMSMHRQPCKDVDNNAESNNILDVE